MKKMIAVVFLIVLTFGVSAYGAQAIISDPEAGLQWVPAPDADMTWFHADDYVKHLRVAGGGWRLPTVAELKSLNDRIWALGGNDALGVKDKFVWSTEIDTSKAPSGAWAFGFDFGLVGTGSRRLTSGDAYVLAVRTQKKH